eukprot:694205-Rhodomonas_salina.3
MVVLRVGAQGKLTPREPKGLESTNWSKTDHTEQHEQRYLWSRQQHASVTLVSARFASAWPGQQSTDD